MGFFSKILGLPGKELGSVGKKDIAMDLGTANTLLYVKGKGIVLNEPSYIAINTQDNSIHAVGLEAKVMWGRSPRHIQVHRPIKDGVINDLEPAQLMIKHFINKALSRLGRIFKPRMIICVPSGITQVEKKAVIDAALQCGAGKVFLIEEPMAAAIGAGLAIDSPQGVMVVDIGGGTTDVAIISMGAPAVSDSKRVAGDEMDTAIVQYVRHNHQVMIGQLEAEEVKIRIGSAYPDPQGETCSVRGRDLVTGTPKEVVLTSAQVAEALQGTLHQILEIIRDVLDQTTPELQSDIHREGIFLTGGGSLVRGMDRFIEEHIGIPVRMAEDPLISVVLGAGRALEEINRFKKAFIT